MSRSKKSQIDAESIKNMNSSENLAANAYIGLGVAAIIPCFIESFTSNGVSEEVFFRGFFKKRFGAKFGINAGIILQAICFGLMHNLLFFATGINVSFRHSY